MSFEKNMSKLTISELKSYAKEHNINLDGVSKKAEILEVILSFNPDNRPKSVSSGTSEKVAVHSKKNLSWNGVGTISVGYNIVTKEASELWVTHKAVRLATPEEVANYYGK